MPDDPFGSPLDATSLFTASYPGECVFGCDIEPGDAIAYIENDLVCAHHYHEEIPS